MENSSGGLERWRREVCSLLIEHLRSSLLRALRKGRGGPLHQLLSNVRPILDQMKETNMSGDLGDALAALQDIITSSRLVLSTLLFALLTERSPHEQENVVEIISLVCAVLPSYGIDWLLRGCQDQRYQEASLRVIAGVLRSSPHSGSRSSFSNSLPE